MSWISRLFSRPVPPVVIIQNFGSLTPNPQVVVSMRSPRGGITVYAYAANESGYYKALYHAKTLAYIAGVELINEIKDKGEFDAQTGT